MPSDQWSPLAVEEYRALRATIRERGTVRWIVIALTFVAWAAITAATFWGPIAALSAPLTLTLLAASFETVFGLHVGAERVGRYIQARYESGDGLPGWEHEAMAIGVETHLATGSDPLCIVMYALATILNAVPMGLVTSRYGSMLDLPLLIAIVTVVFHAAFLWRLTRARRFARRQRAEDLRFFTRHRPAPKSNDPTK